MIRCGDWRRQLDDWTLQRGAPSSWCSYRISWDCLPSLCVLPRALMLGSLRVGAVPSLLVLALLAVVSVHQSSLCVRADFYELATEPLELKYGLEHTQGSGAKSS